MVGFYRPKEKQTKDFTHTLSIGCPRLAVSCFFIRLLFYKKANSLYQSGRE
jgi:hypothetical protein